MVFVFISDLVHSIWQTLGPSTSLQITQFHFFLWLKKYGTLHEFAYHPCVGAMLIFSVSFQF